MKEHVNSKEFEANLVEISRLTYFMGFTNVVNLATNFMSSVDAD